MTNQTSTPKGVGQTAIRDSEGRLNTWIPDEDGAGGTLLLASGGRLTFSRKQEATKYLRPRALKPTAQTDDLEVREAALRQAVSDILYGVALDHDESIGETADKLIALLNRPTGVGQPKGAEDLIPREELRQAQIRHIGTVEHAGAYLCRAEKAEAKIASLSGGEGVAAQIEDAWQSLVEMDDRTSPEEYPDHCLITREELAGYMGDAAFIARTSDPAPSTGVGRASDVGEDAGVRLREIFSRHAGRAADSRAHGLAKSDQSPDAFWDAVAFDFLAAPVPDLEVERLREALDELQDVFAHDGEDSMERFERLAEMFRKDTGYLAPGKDPGMLSVQPEGGELRRIYDEWFAAKVARARAALKDHAHD